MLKTEQVVNKIIEALEDNKAHRIVKIDLRKIENCFCSFFVICHGTSGTHIAGLTDAVEEKVREDLDENTSVRYVKVPYSYDFSQQKEDIRPVTWRPMSSS